MIWLGGFFLIAPLEWVATGMRWRKMRLFTKPLSLILLLIWFVAMGSWGSLGKWFAAGLFFSLIGDVFLLLRPRFFIAGLYAFLLAHLCYITGFLYDKINLSWLALLPAAGIILLSILKYPRFIRGIRRRLENRRLSIPIALYMLTIISMLFLAQLTWFQAEWDFWAALGVSLGALLFTISDTVLAIGRFRQPVMFGNFLVMFTYHLGQFGIAFGVLTRLGLIDII